MLTGKTFHNTLALAVRNLSLIIRLNISLSSKYLIPPVLELPLIQISPHTPWDFYPFDMEIYNLLIFTILWDFVFLLLLEVNKLISSDFPLIRLTRLFLILNSSLSSSFLNMEDPNNTHLRGK